MTRGKEIFIKPCIKKERGDVLSCFWPSYKKRIYREVTGNESNLICREISFPRTSLKNAFFLYFQLIIRIGDWNMKYFFNFLMNNWVGVGCIKDLCINPCHAHAFAILLHQNKHISLFIWYVYHNNNLKGNSKRIYCLTVCLNGFVTVSKTLQMTKLRETTSNELLACWFVKWKMPKS